MTECEVCAERFDSIVHKKVECAGCDYAACRKCVEMYFTSIASDYQCMKCHKLWEDEFVKSHLTQANVKRLKVHRENVLFDREKAWMPATQDHVVQAIRLEKMQGLREQRDQTRAKLATMERVVTLFGKDDQFKTMVEECKRSLPVVKQKETALRNEYENARVAYRTNGVVAESSAAGARRNNGYVSDHVLKCPNGDCKGFIGTNWKCKMCEVNVCKKCHEMICGNTQDDEHQQAQAHECDPENVKTAALVRESTRPCPNCATRIHRISGCTQMWCTQCNTSFDYRTGEVYTRNIHNPHYFEWLRRNPGGLPQEDGPGGGGGCGVDLSLNRFLTHIRNTLPDHGEDPMYFKLADMCRVYYHVRHLMRNYEYVENNQRNQFQVNIDLRIKWMMNKITEDKFKTMLQRKEKQLNTDMRKHQVIAMVSQILRDQCMRVLNSKYNRKEWTKCITQYDNIITYADECFAKLAKIYKVKMPDIHIH